MGKQITVFGASGASGEQIIKKALEKGLKVKAFVRKNSSLKFSLDKVELIQGELSDARDIEKSLEGSSAVVCAFGPRPPFTDIFCEKSTGAIVKAMKKKKVERLICITGGMVGEYPANRTLLFHAMTFLFRNRMPFLSKDREGQEELVKNSELKWTLVKPPLLTDKKAKHTIKAGALVKLGLISSLTREDLSRFIIDELEENRYLEKFVFIKN